MDIEIRTQQEFLALPNTLLESIKKKEDNFYNIALYDNQYYFRENHFIFTNLKDYLDSEKITLKIHAADKQYNVKIAGNSMNNDNTKVDFHNCAYLTTKKKHYNWWQRLWKSKKAVSAPDYPSMWGNKFYDVLTTITVNKNGKKGICELTYDGSLEKLFGGTIWNKDHCYIQVTQWFKSGVYKVTDINFSYNTIEFYCDDLVYNDQKGTYSINNDFNYSKKYFPKFRIANFPNDATLVNFDNNNTIINPKNVVAAIQCNNTNFLYIKDCNCFNKVLIWGITFNGNAYNPYSLSPALIYVTNCDFGPANNKTNYLSVSDCNFINLYSDVIKTSNIIGDSVYLRNKFEKCWRYGIFALTRNLDNSKTTTTIAKNSFKDCGLRYTNTFCVRCDCQAYDISENTFNNYGYGGIAIGTWWNTQPQPTLLHYGRVIENILKNDKSYTFPLMDSGAIYIYTQNAYSTIVGCNKITNYYGRYDNRGIFCDDGAFNFELQLNEIKNTQSYSIDSRRVASTESAVLGGHTNIRNSIVENTFDGNIRFEGNAQFVDDENNKCTLSNNKRTKKVDTQLDIIKNVSGSL